MQLADARILIAEDEVTMADILRDYFEREGCDTRVVYRGDRVESVLDQQPADLVILDLQLPGRDGIDVCRDLRRNGHLPAVIMATARVSDLDRLLGLDVGADDYVSKPYNPREVVARARAVLRRLGPAQPSEQGLTLGVMSLDSGDRTASVGDHHIGLTPNEYALLFALTQVPDTVWTRAQLLERLTGQTLKAYERNVDTHVKNLRKKLNELLPGHDVIRSVYRAGYSLDSSTLRQD